MYEGARAVAWAERLALPVAERLAQAAAAKERSTEAAAAVQRAVVQREAEAAVAEQHAAAQRAADRRTEQQRVAVLQELEQLVDAMAPHGVVTTVSSLERAWKLHDAVAPGLSVADLVTWTRELEEAEARGVEDSAARRCADELQVARPVRRRQRARGYDSDDWGDSEPGPAPESEPELEEDEEFWDFVAEAEEEYF